MRFWSYSLVGLSLVLLSACALSPSTPSQTESAAVAAQQVFERSGRFALSVEGADGSRDAVQGSFNWLEQAQGLQLDLRNPMGTVLARIRVQPQGTWLEYPNGQIEYAASPDELVTQVVGYPIPVEGMRDWLKGQTGPKPTQHLETEQQQPVAFEQDQWRVRLSHYDSQGPTRLQMHRHQSAQSIAVRIVVDY